MEIGYYINRVNTPLEKIDWKQLKTRGISAVYIRCAEENLEAISSHLPNIIAAGLKPYAWTLEGFTMYKEAVDKGWNIAADIENYNILNNLFEIKYIRCLTKTAGKTFILCTKAQDWDGDQKWGIIKDHCDYLQPMLYLGDYNKTLSQLKDYMAFYNTKYPGKIYPALETYISDKNPVPKSKAAIDAEIAAVSPYCNGIALFRYGISNFDNTPIPTPKPTPLPIPNPIKPSLTLNQKIQQKLKDLGYYNGKIDGIMGSYTTASIKAFQVANGLVQDGTAGPITQQILFTTPNSYPNGYTETNGVKLYRQTTGYTCGPSSLKMGLSRYGYNIPEMTLASYAGSKSTSGTTHAGLIGASRRVTSTLTLGDKAFTSVGWSGIYNYLKANVPIVAHIESFINAGKSGHYVLIFGIDMKNRTVKLGDPSYGTRIVPFDTMQKKMAWIVSTGRSNTPIMPLTKP